MRTRSRNKETAATPRNTDNQTVLVRMRDLLPEVRDRIERERAEKRARAKAMSANTGRSDAIPRHETDYVPGHKTDDGGYDHAPTGADGVVIVPDDKDSEGRVRPGTTVVENPTPTNSAGQTEPETTHYPVAF